jgi:O-antigen ligase/Tfp pilus assembly protein PilF
VEGRSATARDGLRRGLIMTKTVFRLYLFTLFFPVAAFGAVESWSLAIMETTSFLALALFLYHASKSRDVRIHRVPGMLPLILLLGYMLVQVIPLPSGVVGIISPDKYALMKESVRTDGPLSWAALTLNKKATLEEFFRLTAYASFYFLTVQLLSGREYFKRTVLAVVIFASVFSFFAVLQHILPNDKIYWIRALTRGGTPFGPYVNRNHYAGLMGMVFPLVISLFLFYKPDFRYESFRERLSDLFNQKVTNIHVLLGLSAALVAMSVFLSLSRGGIVSLSASMVFLGVMLVKNRGGKNKKGIAAVLLFGLIFYAIGWFGWDPIFARFEAIRDIKGDITDLRLYIWRDVLNIIRDFPVAGTGFGTLENIYPRYRTITATGVLDHAHNDYLELLSGGGIVASVLCIWFVTAVVVRSFRAFTGRHETYCRYVFIGSMAGLISILVNSFTDFNLQIGANGLFFFFLLGLMVASAHTRLHGGRSDTFLEPAGLPRRKMLAVAGIILVFSLGFNAGIVAGKIYFSTAGKEVASTLSREELFRMRSLIYRASLFDPLEAKYPFSLANIDWRLTDKTSALRYYSEAVGLDPANGEYLQTLGLVLSDVKDNDNADKLLRAGVKYDRSNPEKYKIFASWLIAHGRKEEGLKNIRAAISLEPGNTKEYITLLVIYGLSDDEILNGMPEMVQPHLAFAEYLDRTGREEMADAAFLRAVDYSDNDGEINASSFYGAYRHFMKKGMRDEALFVMQKAIASLPGNAGIRLTAADTYEKAGIIYRAVEEYRQVLMIDPGNARARKKLDELR